ncbi:MAG: carboxypeptidase-like regulatory domain-containing protein, partial [Flavobacteriales bacterium]
MTLEGTVKDGKLKLSGATIKIMQNGQQVKSATTAGNGKFIIDVPLGKNYKVVFSKPGYVSKRLAIDATSVPENQWLDKHGFPMEVSLFEKMEGLDVSILKNPIGRIAYNKKDGYFDYDEAYTRMIQDKLAKLKKELAAKLKAEEAYKNAIAGADRMFQQNNFSEAKKMYSKAAGIKPAEQYPKDRIALIDKKLGA